MKRMMTRRRFGVWVGTLLAGSLMAPQGIALATTGSDGGLTDKVRGIEERLGARIGVAVLDTQTGHRWEHRGNERFPMSSTFKTLACGAVLARVDAGEEDLDRRIRFDVDDVVTYSPVTEHRVGGDVHWGNDGFCVDVALHHPRRMEDVTIGLLCDTNRFEQALKHLRAADRLKPGDNEIEFWLGATHLALKQRLEGLQLLERVLQREPANAEVLRLLAQSYAEYGAELWSGVAGLVFVAGAQAR